jgi:hypothetical protein
MGALKHVNEVTDRTAPFKIFENHYLTRWLIARWCHLHTTKKRKREQQVWIINEARSVMPHMFCHAHLAEMQPSRSHAFKKPSSMSHHEKVVQSTIMDASSSS